MVDAPILQLKALSAGYGTHTVVKRVNLTAYDGTITAVIGHNGSGKSTLLKAVFGLAPVFAGEIHLAGQRMLRPSPLKWRRHGAAFAPQGNRVFNDLTVEENIRAGAATLVDSKKIGEAVKTVLKLFQNLAPLLSRRAETLSGGEKQLVALAIAMVTRPRLLFLDEPSLGLGSSHLSRVFGLLQELAQRDHVTMVIAEQKVAEILAIADSALVLKQGACVFYGPSPSLRDDKSLQARYLF